MTLMETAQLLGNFGEFAGAIAVVATLFYLANQIRDSADATKAVVRQGMDAGISTYMSAAIDPRTLQQARIKAVAGEPIDDLEHAMLFWHNMMDFKGMEGAFRLYRMGYLDAADWTAVENVIRMKLEADWVARSFWERNDTGFDTTKMYAEDFSARVLELLRAVGPVAPTSLK